MRRSRQSGSITRRRGFWVLRYRERVAVNGEIRTVQRAVRLAPIDAEHRTKATVQDLAEDRLRPILRRDAAMELPTTLGDFVERCYLPHIDEQKKPSTRRGYHQVWSEYFSPRPQIAKAWLRDVRTVHVQGWLRLIATEQRAHCPEHRFHTAQCVNCKDRKLSKPTLQHIKHFLPGVFRFAAQQGFVNGVANPVREAEIPAWVPPGKEVEGYSLEEINSLMRAVWRFCCGDSNSAVCVQRPAGWRSEGSGVVGLHSSRGRLSWPATRAAQHLEKLCDRPEN